MVDCVNSSESKSGTAQVEQSENSTATPYSLYASDNHGAFITSVMFTGENYKESPTKLISALRTKAKLGFINGTIPKLSIDDPNLAIWSSVNSMIVDGIQSSIEARV